MARYSTKTEWRPASVSGAMRRAAVAQAVGALYAPPKPEAGGAQRKWVKRDGSEVTQ